MLRRIAGKTLAFFLVGMLLAAANASAQSIAYRQSNLAANVAGLADNLVRPLLLRNRTRLNDLLLFISILGGLQVFGLLGLVAGPTIVAAGLGVFRVYTAHRDELDRVNA